MSIELQSRVWKSGAYSGGTLLVLLALCDWANDEGERIFPYMETIAVKSRLSIKQVRRNLEGLINDGVLLDVGKTGIKLGVILNFSLNLDMLPGGDKMSLEEEAGHEVPAEGHKVPGDGHGVPEEGHGVPRIIEEPLSKPPSKPSSEPSCTALAVVEESKPLSDLEKAVAMFNMAAESCPKWAACRSMTDARRQAIGARLKTHELAGWQRAVELAAGSAHLGGPLVTTGSHQGWRMDIAWFAKAEHFAKILDGTYAPGRQARLTGLDSIAAGFSAFLRGQDDHDE